jgi:hypothetical protein
MHHVLHFMVRYRSTHAYAHDSQFYSRTVATAQTVLGCLCSSAQCAHVQGRHVGRTARHGTSSVLVLAVTCSQPACSTALLPASWLSGSISTAKVRCQRRGLTR